MKRTLLASAVLMALSSTSFAGQIYEDSDGHTIFVGEVIVDGVTKTVQSVTGEVVIGQEGSIVEIANDSALNRGLSFNTGSGHILGKTISITGANRAVHVSNKATTVKIGNAETENITITQSGTGADKLALTAMLDGSVIDITAKTVEVNAAGQLAVHVQNNNDVSSSPEKRAKVNISADTITVTNPNGAGLSAYSGGELNIKGNLTVNAPRAIETRGNSVININTEGEGTTILNGDIAFATDGPAAGSGSILNSTLNVTLSGEGSSWKGNLIQEYPSSFDKTENKEDLIAVTNATVTLSNGAQWTPTPVETQTAEQVVNAQPLNNLMLNGGVVNITGEDIAVTVENMTGSGTINLATDGETTGTFTVQDGEAALDVNLMNADMSADLTADDITAEQATALLGNVGGDNVTTTTTVEEGMYNSGFGVNEAGDVVSAGPNTVMQSALELASAAPLAMNRILMNDVRKRMGDIRTVAGTSGAWARYDGGRLSGSSGLENDFHTIQVGVDTVPTADAIRFGMAFSYTTSDTDYARGSADMDAYSLAGYGIWLGDNGEFVDVVARMAIAKTDMTVDGDKKGSMDNVALSLSGEYGWRYDVTDMFYVEPQIEATYTYVDADNLTLSNGSSYRFDSVNSLLGRAGVAFGMNCPNNGGNVYARVSAVHEFLGDAAVTGGNGTIHEIDGKDTWVEYGIGAHFNLTDSTYMWTDVERTSGGVLDEDWRATVGVRYSW